MKKATIIFGSTTGNTETVADKIAETMSGYDVQVIYVTDAKDDASVQEADLVLVCKKRYWNDLDPAHMDPDALTNYEAKDYHRMYIGEIIQVLGKV